MPTYYEIMKEPGLLQSFVSEKVRIRQDPDTRARPATFLQKKEADVFGSAGDPGFTRLSREELGCAE